jgi:hypothetical protein
LFLTWSGEHNKYVAQKHKVNHLAYKACQEVLYVLIEFSCREAYENIKLLANIVKGPKKLDQFSLGFLIEIKR